MAGNPNIRDHAVKFSKTRRPTKEMIAKGIATKKAKAAKKRELETLLQLALKGSFGKEINAVLKSEMGLTARTVEEALHFMQISKAIEEKDTEAYKALMAASGLNKPVKADVSVNGFLDFLKQSS